MLSTTPHPPPCGVCVPTQAARENPSVRHIWAYTYLHTIGSGKLQHHCQSDASVMLARVDVNTGVDSIKCLRRVSCSISTMWACFFSTPLPTPPPPPHHHTHPLPHQSGCVPSQPVFSLPESREVAAKNETGGNRTVSRHNWEENQSWASTKGLTFGGGRGRCTHSDACF